jgi:hypothetical protein
VRCSKGDPAPLGITIENNHFDRVLNGPYQHTKMCYNYMIVLHILSMTSNCSEAVLPNFRYIDRGGRWSF